MTMENITTALTNFGSVLTETATAISGNVALMIFLAGGLLVAGFRVFKKAKKAVR